VAAAADRTSRADWPPGRVLVVAATFQERENILPLIDAVLAVDPKLQMLVVDDDSPDGTGELALARAAVEPRLHVLIRGGRRGLGSAILEGLQLAATRGFAAGVNIDADFSHDPRDIPRLLAALEPLGGRPADVVIGSRRVPGGRSVGWPLSRHIASRLVCWFARWLLWIPARDASSGFRAVRLEVLRRLPAHCSSGYAFHEELLLAALAGEDDRAGQGERPGRIVEVPITFTNRAHGRSKARPKAVATAAIDLLRLSWRRISGVSGSGMGFSHRIF